jgi:hypothetical protein
VVRQKLLLKDMILSRTSDTNKNIEHFRHLGEDEHAVLFDPPLDQVMGKNLQLSAVILSRQTHIKREKQT